MNKRELLEEFLQTWPIERLQTMTLEEYTNLNKKDSFCYWLEQRTNDLGGITGGSSFKFGIYKRNNTDKQINTSNALTDGVYAWFDKYGQTKEEAFKNVRDIIVSIVKATSSKDFDFVESVDFGDATKWKIAFLYSNFTLINTFSKDMIHSILDYFNVSYNQGESRLSLSQKVLSKKETDEDFFEFGNRLWSQILISQELKKLLLKLGDRVFPYFNVLDKIVENFGLEPNNDKYYFNYNNKDLIFTIGQRYIWNASKSHYKYISLNKYEDVVEEFKRGENFPDAYLNSVVAVNNEALIFDRLSEAIPFELDSTVKSSFRSNNKKDFQELIFNKEFRQTVFGSLFGNQRQAFINWLNQKFGKENGTNTSYVRAIDILCEILKVNLFSISQKEYFIDLYSDLVKNQKNQFGKYYYEKAKSYGEKGFYSASIQTYIDFLSSDNHLINEPNPTYALMTTNIHLNQILYGPPGTGKTYNTINKSIAIANPDFNLDQDRKIIKAEYQRLVDTGQIVFTTFHQSMSYEDFVEGIKPEVEENEEGDKSIIYNIKDGIFKTICTNALKTEFDKQQVTSAYTFDDAFTALVKEANNGLQNNDPMFLPIQTQNLGLKIVGISDKGNLKLKPIYSEEAKEYTVSYSRAQKLQNAFPNLSVVKNIDKEFREVIGGSNSTAYWAVLNYINNKINENSSSEIVQTELPKKNYILIIDEINRGNVSQIFGELITLIEEDKRIGNDEVIQVTLPYSKTKFGVPKNLYIIGTMNTADKSVEALDAALRRRFVFHEMPPKYEELQSNYQKVFNYSVLDILKTINDRIEVLLNRDHLLGHAYFINKDAEALMQSFQKNIIPLLQEYFYGDYAKIGLVLGSGFIQPKSKGVRFANFTTQADFDSYTDQELYEIKPVNNLTDFEQALVQLMN